MYSHKIASGLAPSATSTTFSLGYNMADLRNRNNIGVVQLIQESGSGMNVTLKGSADGVAFIEIATGITATTGKTVALMPFLQATSTASGTGTASVYIVH
jgi:hypothetical protein